MNEIKLQTALNYEAISDRLKKLRTDADLTQEQLADAILCTRGLISQLENNKTILSINTLSGYCSYFHVSADFILYGKTPVAENSCVKKVLLAIDEAVRPFREQWLV